ncbi:MAG TPA: glycoside hydrolase family 31 protein, partial [Clostridia bacterium]|nr:glycoside hydrolase family 31 protein [Clostridia bacterium]
MKRYHVFIILIFSLVLAINIISNNKELDNWNHEGNVRFSNSTFVVSTTDKNFVHKEVAGDKTITARVFDASNNAAAGLELRERDTDRLVSFISSDNEDVYLRLVKTGNIVRQYKSKDGKAWELVDETSIPKLSDNLYLGMVVSSKDSKKKAQAKFKNVSIDDTNNLRTLCSETIGDVRIQILSPTVVRIEQKGPKGFEDRNTFHIEQRDWIGASYKKETKGNHVHLSFDEFVIKVRKDAKSIYNVSIYKKDDTLLWEYSNESNSKWLPGPSENTEVWSIIDKPRVVPSEHGFIPQEKEIENNGWDLNNDADDVYVFLPKGEYRTLRLDFINLTGRTDMIPMYALGNWESKYYPYSDKTALDRIEAFRKRSIPLDVLVIDTDWRVGGSDGYIINTELFPDVESFFNNAH